MYNIPYTDEKLEVNQIPNRHPSNKEMISALMLVHSIQI